MKKTFLLLAVTLFSMGPILAQSKPFLGAPQQIPGVIRPELYDAGGKDVAYHDQDTTNNGPAGQNYRPKEGVDLEAATVGAYANGYDLGWTNAGEWVNYTVDVKQAGKYNVTALFASGGGGGNLVLKSIIGKDTTILDTLKFKGTGGWQAWDTLTASVTLKKGVQILQYGIGGGFNVNTITFAYDYQLGSNNEIPGTILTQNFSTGGEGVAFHITNKTKNGDTTVRHGDIVSLEGASIGGYDLGWTNTGDWVKYPVNIDSTADYQVELWLASGGSGGTLSVEFKNSAKSDTFVVKGTGGWQSYVKMIDTIHLTKGQDTMRLMEVTGGYNITSPIFRLLGTKLTTLDSIKVDGKMLPGFSPFIKSYFGKRIKLPTVEAFATDKNATVKIVTDTVPGVTNIVVTSADKASTNIYQIVWANPVKITTLSEIKVAGKMIAGFSSSKKSYDIMLKAGTTAVPMVTAKATNEFATVKVTPAKSIPGATTILVTAEDTSAKFTVTINFSDSTGTGLKKNEINSLNVHPNPASTQTIIELSQFNGAASLQVIGLDGKVAISKDVTGMANYILNTSALQNSVYIVVVKNNEKVYTTRLLIKK